MVQRVQAVVVGGGVIGLAVGRALARAGREVLVLERGTQVGAETSSRNSEVIHAGLYYPQGSLKARLCRDGRDRLYPYLAARGVAHARCGKIIVASHPDQVPRLEEIRKTAAAAGVTDLEPLSAADVRALEPEVSAVGGLLSPSTGILDAHGFMSALEGDLHGAGGQVVLQTDVAGMEAQTGGIRLHAKGGGENVTLEADTVVNCAGLGAVALAQRTSGLEAHFIPPAFRAIGHYYVLSGKAPFSRLVYPVPEDGGLGVHVTLDTGGQARFGPDVRWQDGFASDEPGDYSFDDSQREHFIQAIRAYYPGLDAARLHPGYTGIRPKISGPGAAAADFRIDGPEHHGIAGLVNLFGIESPGLTASLAIADEVLARLGIVPVS